MDCLDEWAGAKQAAALGSVDDGSSVCCPANPTVSVTSCQSFALIEPLTLLCREVQMILVRRTRTRTVYRTCNLFRAHVHAADSLLGSPDTTTSAASRVPFTIPHLYLALLYVVVFI